MANDQTRIHLGSHMGKMRNSEVFYEIFFSDEKKNRKWRIDDNKMLSLCFSPTIDVFVLVKSSNFWYTSIRSAFPVSIYDLLPGRASIRFFFFDKCDDASTTITRINPIRTHMNATIDWISQTVNNWIVFHVSKAFDECHSSLSIQMKIQNVLIGEWWMLDYVTMLHRPVRGAHQRCAFMSNTIDCTCKNVVRTLSPFQQLNAGRCKCKSKHDECTSGRRVYFKWEKIVFNRCT